MSKSNTDTITLRKPDDMHLHLRDGDLLSAVAPLSARHFGRAIVMPNLVPPVVTANDARAYRKRILDACHEYPDFEPLMTLYLTETTDETDVAAAAAEGLIHAVKLYPAGATTNSQSGVRDIDKVMPLLERMAQDDIVLCIHGEVTKESIDIFDREAAFIETVLDPLRQRLPELRIVFEHITTRDAVDYVTSAERNLAATLTVHHLMLNRNDMLAGGIRPHYYCLPILKRNTHQEALVRAATSGDPRFFLGTDSAPHLATDKESPCGCAGCFTAPNALSCIATVFEQAGRLDRMEAFTSVFGAEYYGLPLNDQFITLDRSSKLPVSPDTLDTPSGKVVVFHHELIEAWSVKAK